MISLLWPAFACFMKSKVLSSTGTSLTSRALARSITAEAGAVVPIVITCAWPSFSIDTASVYEAWKLMRESDWYVRPLAFSTMSVMISAVLPLGWATTDFPLRSA
jgi:hypothetical protein